MAISNISITQDNKVGSSDLIPIHSPVVFIAEATYTGLAPDELSVNIYDIDSILVASYRAVYLDDTSTTVRRFAFIANDAIKSLMENFDDIYQLSETFIEIPEITEIFTIRFFDPDLITTLDEVTVNFIHGAAQFGENANLTDVFNNSENTYYGKENEFAYVYYYNDTASSSITITDNGVNKGAFAADEIGYYRYKTNIDTTEKIINFNNGTNNYDQNVKQIDSCTDDLLLKFLDNNGQYRFLVLSEYYEGTDNPENIGFTDEFIYNISNSGGNSKNLGYRNKRRYTASTEADNNLLDKSQDIYSSPRIYLKIGSTDTSTDWVEVNLRSSDGIVKRRKGNSGSLNFTIELPERFSVKMV